MSIIVKVSERKELTKISCCECGERVKGIGLEKGSEITGLNFRCKKCGRYNSVRTESAEK